MVCEIIGYIIKATSAFTKVFWKNKNIVYCNSNVKILNKEEVRPLIKPSDSKIIRVQTHANTLKKLRLHLFYMRLRLWRIKYNASDSCKIYHCGFPSQMFAVYDGYMLGNTNEYNLIDYNGSYYAINSIKIKEATNVVVIPNNLEEINIVLETSYAIDADKIKPNYTLEMKQKAPNKITKQYIEMVYNYIKSVLDACGSSNVKIVNIYMTAKQSVAFAVGLAIQDYHPNIRVFEYRDNKYICYLDVKNHKIIEV